jgi:hypothetical protein
MGESAGRDLGSCRFQMTAILATILKVKRQGGEYFITIVVGSEEYSGKFEGLAFENKPDLGWYRRGWLDLVYHRDPGLKTGNLFPLWAI